MDFVVGLDISTERLEYFHGEMRHHLLQMKEAYNSLNDVTGTQKTRIGNQLNKFIQSFKDESKYQERFVVSVGDNPDLSNFDETYLRYHICNLNDNLPFAYTVPKTAVIYFVESSQSSTSFSKSHLTPNGISKFLKRNFIFKEIDEIHVQSPSLSNNEDINIFLSSSATQLRQRGEGNKALENEGKRMSEEAKEFALKDAAKDEINNRRKRSACALRQRDVELVEDSVEITDAGIKFKVYEMNNHRQIHEITDDISLSTKALSKRQNILLSKIHLGLGVHSVLANFFGALHYFQTGDNARGGFLFFTKIDYKLAESTAGRIVNTYLQQSAKKIASTLFKDDTMVEKAVSKIDLLIRSVPIVGIAFDIYFIEEDIVNLVENQDRDLVPLYVIDIFLDSVISLLSFDPLLEPVVLALSMVRMVFDDVYIDILEEWKRVKGKGVLRHLLAVIFGIVEGLGDFVTLGFVRQMRELNLQEQTYMEFLNNLSTVENYFQFDLNAGEDHMFGGLVTVRLFDNDTFEIEIEAVPTISGLTVIKKSFNGKIRDVILGIGQSTDLANYGMTSAKIFIFPVKDYHTFEFKPTPVPAFGQYFGNMYNNTFAAIRGYHLRTQDQQCHDLIILSNVSINLDNISYFISGKDDGGRGQDSYFIPWYGGFTNITNFADDNALDSLFLNISYDAVQCVRNNDDLHIHYCGKRTVAVQHWSASTARTYHQHLRIITNDGVTIEPISNETETNGVKCYPTEIDLSHKTKDNNVDLSLSNFQHVTTVVGSNVSDIITGNDNGNILSGGVGAETLKGGEGEDVYVISSGEGCDIINITSKERSTKRIIFNVVCKNIEVKLISSIKVKVVDSTDPLKTCFSIVDVNTFSNQPSVSIITIDNIIFEIKYNEDSGIVEKVPLILDFSKSQENVSINLLTPEYGNIQMSERDKDNVITIMDSTYSDHIIANNKDNFLSCSGGDPDYLEGRGGHDLYVIQKTCSKALISNYDPFEKLDKVIVKSDYKLLRIEIDSKDSVVIRSKESAMMIVLLNWFVNSTYQHLVVETEDGVTCTVPTSKDEVMTNMNLLPVEMRFTEQSCKNEFHTTLYLNDNPFKNVQKVVARPKSCIVSVIGNALGNHIDLGPTSVTER
ncbi:hypothetical protein ACJMK2_018662 [Sinanodonta woodiana]|uniref:Uncharacterized protein n=1 Tax=Sinanodonta woodiana TaxID=1069815 RepID=A0ABD3UH67_SINWO